MKIKKETVKIMKISKYSRGIVIPAEFMKGLRWKEKQKIVVELKGKGLALKDWKNKK